MDDYPHGAEERDAGGADGARRRLSAPELDGILKFLQLKEALATAAMTHRAECRCDVCLAAFGDREAFYRMWLYTDG